LLAAFSKDAPHTPQYSDDAESAYKSVLLIWDKAIAHLVASAVATADSDVPQAACNVMSVWAQYLPKRVKRLCNACDYAGLLEELTGKHYHPILPLEALRQRYVISCDKENSSNALATLQTEGPREGKSDSKSKLPDDAAKQASVCRSSDTQSPAAKRPKHATPRATRRFQPKRAAKAGRK
jgi:hypothetical protein